MLVAGCYDSGYILVIGVSSEVSQWYIYDKIDLDGISVNICRHSLVVISLSEWMHNRPHLVRFFCVDQNL